MEAILPGVAYWECLMYNQHEYAIISAYALSFLLLRSFANC